MTPQQIKQGKSQTRYSKQYPFIKVLHRTSQQGGKGKSSAMNAAFKDSKRRNCPLLRRRLSPTPRYSEETCRKSLLTQQLVLFKGRPVVLNEPQNILTRLIALERIGGYRVDQEARDALGLVPQFGGTVGGFRRSIVDEFGGFDESMLTEDTDLTFHIYLAGYKIRYVETQNAMRKQLILGRLIGGKDTDGQKDTCKFVLSMHLKSSEAKK